MTTSNIPTKGNGNTQACAACKYQRRKCAPDCILAPYFPHDRQRQFLNAHKLFGVSNITKIIKKLDQPDKDKAMHTIIFQSDVRANDPVGGCYRIIREYQRQIEYYKAELDIVLHQLAICRAQAHHHVQVPEAAAVAGEPNLNCEMVNVVDPLSLYNNPMAMAMQPHYQCQLQPQQESYVNVVHDQGNHGLQEDVSSWVMQDDSLHSLHTKQDINGDDHDCDEDIKPLFEVACERNENKFDTPDIVEHRFVPSPQLLTSS
ncbi:hypothetical protein FEM48_Zijuj01G0280100 [Ziziphus jujuba var. spinosa]|uniref:LOB domain-containing protein n=1 Tax=Ziziphus jujuba var. spinosa TaxID=714518 RepID=A0A978W5C7_ZIZJJ|nr:hypothetical protein FEM48_Zijuj01G0280100 [Ziziphus jujuba var. spinosa]